MRKQSVRMQDVQDAGKLILRAIKGQCSPQERFQAALALSVLSDEEKEQLAAAIPSYKSKARDSEIVHPAVIRKTRANCSPFPVQPLKRNVRNLWLPNGHLRPSICLK